MYNINYKKQQNINTKNCFSDNFYYEIEQFSHKININMKFSINPNISLLTLNKTFLSLILTIIVKQLGQCNIISMEFAINNNWPCIIDLENLYYFFYEQAPLEEILQNYRLLKNSSFLTKDFKFIIAFYYLTQLIYTNEVNSIDKFNIL